MELFSEFSLFPALLCVVAGCLIGNFQTAILISKFILRDDVRLHGSGNAGSTNMLRVFGLRPGLFTFLGDFTKGIVGVLAGRLLMGTLGGYIAALFVVIAHCYPIFAGFRGGKGVASTFSVMWMSFPLAAAIVTGAGILILLLGRRISVVSLSCTVLYLALTIALKRTDIALILLMALLTALVYFRHSDNIARLLRGEEKPLWGKKK